MPKRYFSTDLFHEDWFVDLDPEHKLFWCYALLNCDHAGFLRVNLRVFNALNGTSVVPEAVFKEINTEKPRLREITTRVWFIEDFIPFQYGQGLNENNRVHKSVIDLLEKYGVCMGSIKGLINPLKGVKEKDKEKDQDNIQKGVPKPPTLENVERTFVRLMTAMALPLEAFGGHEKLAKSFFDHYGSQGWRKGNDMPIYKYELLISKWLTTEKGRMASTKSTTRQQRPWD